ncbi:LOW QUALITY PROTEIN: hypothetical protein TorRG33x02_094730 [Trema orientale]|uniref:Uncharacterized protein n=1 Tax=Trema orientale TaxID=63057 RepID=A0A2P5FA75_TREOI|nr:LOW QUALITY PROTEIN: hypothetical protein TorRG33x02_094730 [Trema orientale]
MLLPLIYKQSNPRVSNLTHTIQTITMKTAPKEEDREERDSEAPKYKSANNDGP